MRQSRWDQAKFPNSANPTPLFPQPSNYDIKLTVDHEKLIAYIGPLAQRQPPGQENYDNATVTWRQGKPNDVVKGYDFKNRISYQYPTPGIWKFQIDWYKGTTLRATTKQDLVV